MNRCLGPRLPAMTTLAVFIVSGMGCGQHENPGATSPAATRTPTSVPFRAARVDGGIDVISSVKDTANTGTIKKGEMARADGWTLIDGKTPALAVLKIDVTGSGETSSFQSRADVNSFFGRDVGSCAWRIDFQTADLMRGSHQAQVLGSQGAGQPGLVLGRATTFRVSD